MGKRADRILIFPTTNKTKKKSFLNFKITSHWEHTRARKHTTKVKQKKEEIIKFFFLQFFNFYKSQQLKHLFFQQQQTSLPLALRLHLTKNTHTTL